MQFLRTAVREFGKKRIAGHQLAFSVCKNFLMGYYNTDRNPYSNGEFDLIDRLSLSHDLRTFFDVGAHKGDWTQHVLDRFPRARVHAFEVSPRTAKALRDSVTDQRATLNDFGLSDHAGKVALSYYPNNPDNTSIHANDRLCETLHGVDTEQALVKRGDDYCEELDITHIDYLKIDAEGHDFFVLKGLDRMIRAQSVDLIQFEYNQAAIGARAYLRDFYDLLDGAYRIHRITPKGPVEEGYGMFSENFLYSNFLAVLATGRVQF